MADSRTPDPSSVDPALTLEPAHPASHQASLFFCSDILQDRIVQYGLGEQLLQSGALVLAFTLWVSTRPCRDTSLCIVDASIDMPCLRQKLTDEERNAALASFANQIGIDQAPAVIAEKKMMPAWKGLQIFFETLLLLIVGLCRFLALVCEDLTHTISIS